MGGRVGLLGELEASLQTRVGRLGDPQGSLQNMTAGRCGSTNVDLKSCSFIQQAEARDIAVGDGLDRCQRRFVPGLAKQMGIAALWT